MSDIVEVLRKSPDYIGGRGRSYTEIESAEKNLEIKFAPDYRKYLKEIGLVSFDGHELTGISKNPRLNVVDVTTSKREIYPQAGKWYVIEEANIDGIVIWQDIDGKIFITGDKIKSKHIANSLIEYIKNVL